MNTLARTAMALTLACAATAASRARAEALSTTSLGIGVRSLTFTPSKSGNTGEEGAEKSVQETYNDPMLCQRISTPSSLGVELGAGGCVHGGGFWTFAHTISAHLQLIYYPAAARARIDDDKSISMRRSVLGDFYLVGQGGFAKITHGQTQATTSTYSMDLIEFGGGAGWSYRMFRNVALGAEGFFLLGSVLSKAATGSTSMLQVMGSVTVFL